MHTIKSFSLIIPAYNEEERLPKTLERVLEWSKKVSFDLEILVIDDGSIDKTVEIVKKIAKKEPHLQLIPSKHLGKMPQVFKGFQFAKKDIVGVMDADLAADPEEFLKLFQKLPKADIVMGSRYLRGNLPPITGKPFLARTLSKGFTLIFRFFFKIPLYDPQIGFKIYKRNIFKNLLPLVKRTDGFADTEIIIKAFGLGLKIAEVPINYHHVSANSKINRISSIFPVLLALLDCWYNSFLLFKQKKIKYQPSRDEFLLKILYLMKNGK
jgi:dolichyl-phosphate beta-glucosyltransferase